MPQRKQENKKGKNSNIQKKPSKRKRSLHLIGNQSKSNRTKDQNEKRREQLDRHNKLRMNISGEKTAIEPNNIESILCSCSDDIVYLIQEINRNDLKMISLDKLRKMIKYSNKIFYRHLVCGKSNDGHMFIKCECVFEKQCPVCLQLNTIQNKIYLINGMHLPIDDEYEIIQKPQRMKKLKEKYEQIPTKEELDCMEFIFKNGVIIEESSSSSKKKKKNK